ncbi:hypothetical protein C8J57DRAFT_1727536 [Mycena rebaudengoi]|nr:hypothetical protein C8J57DRAFT_1727536 [Mycena rebaudengoi]
MTHDSLLLQKLQEIEDLPLRTIATRAANGSLKDLDDLFSRAKDMPTVESKLILPVFYANLDLTRMPTAAAMDAIPPSSSSLVSVEAAFTSLRLLGLGPGHLTTALDFWPRVWKWTNFLLVYSSCIGVPEESVGFTFLAFLAYMPREANEVIVTIPGVRRVFARAWTLLFQTENLDKSSAAFDGVAYFLSWAINPSGRDNFAEFIDGAGGTPDDLASLVVKHIHHFMPLTSRDVLPKRSVLYMITVLKFVDETTEGSDGVFDNALLARGIIRTLTVTLLRLVALPDCPALLFKSCFVLLTRRLHYADHRWLRVALKEGLLRVILLCSIHPQRLDIVEVGKYVREVLSFSTVYYPTVSQLAKSLPFIEHLERSTVFRSSSLYRDWLAFSKLVEKRIALKNQLDSEGHRSLRACDNLECGRITEKENIRRCAGCVAAYYCNRICQTRDWKADHKNECQRLHAARRLYPANFTTRETSFMRAILTQDYQTAKRDMWASQIACMSANPTVPIYTSFDYTRHTDPVVCVYKPDMSTHFRYIAAEWDTVAARVARSRGRMELHLICVHDRGKAVYRIFPMRLATSERYRGILRIAQIATGEGVSAPRVIQGIQVLLTSHADEVIIH